MCVCVHIHIYNGILLDNRKTMLMPSAATRMDLKVITLSQRKENII